MSLGKYFRFLRKKEPTKLGEVKALPDVNGLDRPVIGNLYTRAGVFPIYSLSIDVYGQRHTSFSGEVLGTDFAETPNGKQSSIRVTNMGSRNSVWAYSNFPAYSALTKGETADVKITNDITPVRERVQPLEDKAIRLEDLHPEGDYNEEDLLNALHISMSESLAASNRLRAMFK